MALVMTQPINAAVKVIMPQKENEYGPYQSVLFESPELAEGQLWRYLKPYEAQQLTKGQRVELKLTTTTRGKEAWNIRPLSAPAEPQQITPAAAPPRSRFNRQPHRFSSLMRPRRQPP